MLGELTTSNAVAGSSSRHCRRRPSPSSPSRTASTRTSSTARPPATRSSSSRRSPPAREGIPDTVRDAVLARAAHLSPARADGARGGRGRSPADRALAARGSRRRRRRGRSRRVSGVGHARAAPAGVAFRHELARLAIEESVGLNRASRAAREGARGARSPRRRRPRSRAARPPRRGGRRRGRRAALRPGRGCRAASLGAHREAAAQYARALRFGDRLSPAERAELLERRSHACYLTDQSDEAIEAIADAVAAAASSATPSARAMRCAGCRRSSGARAARASLAACGREAVALLETLPPGVRAGDWPTQTSPTGACREGMRDEARGLGRSRARRWPRASARRRRPLHAFTHDCRLGGRLAEQLEGGLERAQQGGFAEQAGRMFLSLVGDRRRRAAATTSRLAISRPVLDYCGDHGLELFRLYLLADRARSELEQGRWAEAAESAALVLRTRAPRSRRRSTRSSCSGSCARGAEIPGQWALLDEALALAEPSGELPRLAPVAAARAEAAWLVGDRDGVASATEAALPLALELNAALGDRRADRVAPPGRARRRIASVVAAEPYALQLAGDWAGAAALLGASSAARTRPRSPSRMPTRTSRCGRRSPSSRHSRRGLRRRSSRAVCASAASGSFRAGRGPRHARTRTA